MFGEESELHHKKERPEFMAERAAKHTKVQKCSLTEGWGGVRSQREELWRLGCGVSVCRMAVEMVSRTARATGHSQKEWRRLGEVGGWGEQGQRQWGGGMLPPGILFEVSSQYVSLIELGHGWHVNAPSVLSQDNLWIRLSKIQIQIVSLIYRYWLVWFVIWYLWLVFYIFRMVFDFFKCFL